MSGMMRYLILVPVLLTLSCGKDATGPGPPHLRLERTTISLTVSQFTQLSEQFLVSNDGGGELKIWDATIDLPWLSVSPESLTIQADSSRNLIVTADPGGTAQGSYLAKLRFSSNDPGYSTVLVTIGVVVESGSFEPITVTPQLVFVSLPQDESAIRTLTLRNPGELTRSIIGVTTDCDWASVDPTAITLDPGATQTTLLTISSEGLSLGQHLCDVSLYTDDPWVPILPVSVQLGVEEVVAAQRVVVAEEFTGTWCQHCPSAMQGLHNLRNEVGDALVVVAYHIFDDFSVEGNEERAAYYNVEAYPDVYFDGIVNHTGGSGSSDPVNYGADYAQRATVGTLVTMDMTVDGYEGDTGIGRITALLSNAGTSSMDFSFHLLLTGIDTLYTWQDFNHLYYTVLDHQAGNSGMPITLAPGETESTSFDFTVPSEWRQRECEFVAFAQDDASREILQGAAAAIE